MAACIAGGEGATPGGGCVAGRREAAEACVEPPEGLRPEGVVSPDALMEGLVEWDRGELRGGDRQTEERGRSETPSVGR